MLEFIFNMCGCVIVGHKIGDTNRKRTMLVYIFEAHRRIRKRFLNILYLAS